MMYSIFLWLIFGVVLLAILAQWKKFRKVKGYEKQAEIELREFQELTKKFRDNEIKIDSILSDFQIPKMAGPASSSLVVKLLHQYEASKCLELEPKLSWFVDDFTITPADYHSSMTLAFKSKAKKVEAEGYDLLYDNCYK